MKGTAVVKQCETLLAPYSAKRLVTKKSPAISLISQAATGRVGLFNFNFSASFFQRFFQCFSVIFAHAFFQSGRSRFYQVFSFFQTQASCATYCFDNSNFVSASSFQNYVEFSFFFSSFSRASSYSYSSSSGNTEFFFHCRNQFYNVHYGHSGYCFNDLIFSDRHLNCS
ncbi:hypothetical protein SPAB_05141 [Salmonella enterica subsp. enterica serovar Paratyphi B str. SPB7]|uniref:Uncharacterized protein n=1 Tax=Salmonella paratyphi B (strain ATCC BAA-1250 / SPB7) TaxID=1016998 RepID=A0A6C6Z8P2_SALPB|nr:hypothetical protein SPAB_05141 [Salmonella enterica subsp. enterica serovar Paratyphi B str. SPB7]